MSNDTGTDSGNLTTVTTPIYTDYVYNTTEATVSTVTVSNATTESVVYNQAFIQSPFAQGIAGTFAVLSVLLTAYQVVLFLRCFVLPVQRKCIVRILLMVPVYAINSFLSLIFFSNENYYIYFNTIRDCYEAVVIYSFMCLCYEYLGGEGAIMNEITGQPVKESLLLCTCCLTRKQYSLSFLRFCKRATLQFCFVKPVVAVITLVLQTYNVYKDGDFSVTKGYLYVTIVYNVSIGVAMYGLVLFYMATEDYLKPHKPLLKFCSVKAIIFVSFWQGVLLAILEKAGVINPIYIDGGTKLVGVGTVAGAYQNFIICIEMLFAALCLWFAFPRQPYEDETNAAINHKSNNKGNSLRSISYGLSETINPADIVADAIHNFHPHYQQYARHDTSDLELCAVSMDSPSPTHRDSRKGRSGGRRKDYYDDQPLEVPSSESSSSSRAGTEEAKSDASERIPSTGIKSGSDTTEGPAVMPGLERRGRFSEKTNLLKSNEEIV